jgi:hypothetical protein
MSPQADTRATAVYAGTCEFCASDVTVTVRLSRACSGREEGFDMSSCPGCGALFPVELVRVS